MLGQPLSCHANDHVCGGPLRAVVLVDRAGTLIVVEVAPERHVDLVFLRANKNTRQSTTVIIVRVQKESRHTFSSDSKANLNNPDTFLS